MQRRPADAAQRLTRRKTPLTYPPTQRPFPPHPHPHHHQHTRRTSMYVVDRFQAITLTSASCAFTESIDLLCTGRPEKKKGARAELRGRGF